MNNKALIPGNLFGKFADDFFNRSISDIVGRDFTMNIPSVNIIESENNFSIELAAPGLSKEDFNVSIDKDELLISANKETNSSETAEDKKYTRREYSYASFTRRFRIPEIVEKDGIEAKYENGILYLTLNKTDEAKKEGPKRIEIG